MRARHQRVSSLLRLGALAALVVALAGCAATRPGAMPAAQAIGPAVDDLDPASLALAAERSAAALSAMPPSRTFPLAGGTVTAKDLAGSAKRVAAIARGAADPPALTRRLASDCQAFAAGAPAKVTGYYEPVLAARRAREARFRYPLYRLPSPAQLAALEHRLGRMPTRADIDGHDVLDGLGLEIAWVDDPVARFFLQVQGSGRLDFGDGTSTRIGYAGSNDLPYRSVGGLMLQQGLLEPGRATAPAMRAWLASHPSRRDALLFENPRYVFFRETGGDGPVGSLGTTLVAGRSIAADDDVVPKGILAWLTASPPAAAERNGVASRRALARFVFAQDTGAAIQGPGRVDLFEGSGEGAGLEAGVRNDGGEFFLMLCPARPDPSRMRTSVLGGMR